MNKKELLDKVKNLDGLSADEKAYLINLVNTKKKYGLVWEDKPEDVEEQLRTHLPVLKEVKDRAIINDTETEKHPNHILIEGDNLHALTSLTFTHEGKIDLIYIDPPYNTGEKDFRYNDTYVDKEDAFRHSKWLSFIDKRLQIAKKLLSDTGVIICHIDENEYDNLSVLLKEIFNEQNNLGTIVWNKKNPKGDAKGVANMHEYIFCYAKNKASFLELDNTLKRDKENATLMINRAKRLFSKIGKTEIPKEIKEVLMPFDFSNSLIEKFKVQYDIELVNKEFKSWLQYQDFSKGEKMYKYIDTEGKVYRGVSMAWPNKQKAPDDYFIPLIHPVTKKECPIPNRGWRNPSSTMEKLLGKGEIIQNPDGSFLKGEILFGKDENKQPERKYKLEDNLKENISSIFNYGGSDDSLLDILQIDFPYLKPLDLAKYLIKSIHPNPKILLDFFAGTGPALHASMEINKEDNRRITCLIATNNENYIADDCYKRNKLVINGYEDKKGKVINGLTSNNLRYYQTDFVERETSLTNKRKLTQLSTELLCIKEDCYTEVTSHLQNVTWHKFFTDGTSNYVYVIYDDMHIEDGVAYLSNFIEQNPEAQIKVYVFANGPYPYTEEFEAIAENVELAALPDAIYKAYQNILPKQNKVFIPVLDEDTPAELDLFKQ